jgi:hypothetical protein
MSWIQKRKREEDNPMMEHAKSYFPLHLHLIMKAIKTPSLYITFKFTAEIVLLSLHLRTRREKNRTTLHHRKHSSISKNTF